MSRRSLQDPADDIIPIDVSGGDQSLPDPCVALYCAGSDSTLVVETKEGTNRTITLVGGVILPLRVRKIVQSGTTANSCFALM